ncbi:MAG: hypothetical protein ACLQBK_09350 [Candidatus Sulfotelmatobacter sp.]
MTSQLTEVLQLEAPAELHDAPKLLVEWSSPWREFVTAIGPALSRSEARLAGEAPYGLFPYRGMVPCWLFEAFLIFAAIVVPVKLAQLRPYVVPRLSSHDIIYYSGDELPRTADLGGAQAGTSGQAGGDEAYHHTQTIKIARGGSLVPKVVDAPNLRLPPSSDAVANLLAVKPNPGPPPLEGVRSMRSTPNLSTVIAPVPNVIRDYTRNGITMDAVVPPAPNFSRDQPLTAPTLNANVIPPAPNVPGAHMLVAPALGPAVIPPAPSVSRDRTQTAPSLNVSVVAPAPSAPHDQERSAPSLAASVIPPAPGAISREISDAPVQMTNVAVVPPPVSSPERASTRDPKLTLPAPSVIAPPPSADVSKDLSHLASGSVPDPFKAIVPPPPTQAGSGSSMSSLIGKIFGPSEVVPPPPTVKANAAGGGTGASLATNVVPPPPTVSPSAGGNPHGTRNGAAASLATNVVPPPPTVSANAGGNSHGNRNGAGASLPSNVIAPPPSAGVSGGTGPHSLAPSAAPALGPPSIVPPPPSLTGQGGGINNTGGGAGVPTGTLANNIVPPPPNLAGGSNATGSGIARRGAGLGLPLDVGSPVAPPTTGGSGTNQGVVVSSHPGSKVGLPTTGGAGALAMSPSGGDNPGLGGSGGGAGIGRGTGPGSGVKGEGPGAGKAGPGRGSDPNAHGGTSPSPGPGGAGTAPSGTPSVPGVSVSGGSSIITLPSFGSDPAANDPSGPGRSSLKQRQTFDVNVVATANSGGPFEPYKSLLHGETHTIYPETGSSSGAAAMQYADESATGRGTLTAPQPIRTGLPEGLPHLRIVIACTLDASGNLKNMRVLEPGPADMITKVLAALGGWKFRPALRGSQPVEVTAILGFNIDTNDRF